MGGYGSMNLVIRNNNKMLSGREKFKKGITSYSNKKTEYNLPKATPQLLQKIKKRMIEEHQIRNKKIIFFCSLIMVIVISLTIYLLQ